MKESGASLSSKGPLSRVCRAAENQRKILSEVKLKVLLSKGIRCGVTFQLFLLQPFIMSIALSSVFYLDRSWLQICCIATSPKQQFTEL